MKLTEEERYALVLLLDWIIRSVDNPDSEAVHAGVRHRLFVRKETIH